MNPLIEQFKRDMESFEEEFDMFNATLAKRSGSHSWENATVDDIEFRHTQSLLNLISKMIEECEGRKEEICNSCAGEGKEIAGENLVTRDMAIDAGDISLAGSHHSYDYQDCRVCEGAGKIKVNNSALSDTILQLQEFKEYLLSIKEN